VLNTILRGHYKIISHLGSGGFGQTYLAEDIDLPRHPICVVKQLKPVSNEPFVLETAKRLFDQEAAMLYSLGSHDHIPRLLAHFQEGEEFYLVQEFADGTDLTQEIGKDKRSPEAVAIALLKEVLEILVYVHDHHVIHRDIKPANLIRRKSDRKIVLIDFGAVKEISNLTVDPQGNTDLSIAIGSSGYMPIEQLNGKPRFSSDIYALGMMIIQAITGAEPRLFAENPDTAELIWRDRLSQGSYSPQFLDILDKMIRYDFRQRYQTANEVLEAISMLPSATEHALPTTLLHGGNNHSVSNLATVVVSPQVRSPYAQDEHPSQLHTVAFQKKSPRPAFPLWMWISGGALLLLLTIMAIVGKSMKNVPEVINTPSPTPSLTATAKPTPTATPSPKVTPTPTPSSTFTPTPTATPTPTDTPLPIPAPEFQPQPQDIPAPLVDRQPPSKKGGKKK
jgi:serine/threonine-protein kinase